MRIQIKVFVLVFALLLSSFACAQEEGTKMRREIALGYNQSSGNTETDEFLGRVDFEIKRAGDDFSFFAECFNSSESDKTSSERAAGEVSYAYAMDFEKRWLHSFNIAVDHDRFADIDLRALVSTGIKWLFLKTEAWEAGTEFSVGYEYTDFYTAEPDTREEVVLIPSAFISKEFKNGTRISQSVKFFTYPDSDAGYRIEARTALQSALTKLLAVRISLDNFYDSDPNDDIEEHDMRLVSSLVCSF